MKIAQLPGDEVDRLAVLSSYEVLDTSPELAFDDLVKLAAQICETPIALISLVDDSRQWFKAKVGLDAEETPRDIAFCSHAILQPEELLVVQDTLADVRFADNPLVTGAPGIRFYAGAPLVTPEGHALGTLCVIDRVPRDFAEVQRRALRALSNYVVAQLVLRRQARQLRAEMEERQRVEARFAAANAWQRTILDSADLSIISTDPYGLIQTFNAAAERMLGYPKGEVVGRILSDEIYDATEMQHRAAELSLELERPVKPGFDAFTARARAGIHDTHEWTLRRKGGQWFSAVFTVTAMHDPAGEITGFMGVGSDLTERKREQEQFRLVVEGAPNGILMVDEAGLVKLVNSQTEKLFGYTRNELIGQRIEILLPESLDGQHQHHRQQFFADPKARAMGAGRDLSARRKDGSEFPVEIGLNPIVTAEGTAVLATVVDVTQRKRDEVALRALNQQLRLATEKAQAADRIKSTFLATMSHELRTPLNSIIGFSGILFQELAGPLNAEQKKQLGMVRESSRHLLALVNDVLDISKIEAEQMEVSSVSFPLAESLKKAVALVSPLAEKKGLALEVEIDSCLGMMVSDQRRLEQIVINLLNNAIKFTEAGRIRLSAEAVDDASSVQSGGSGPAVRLQVSDTGIGIRADQISGLFLPFQQVDDGLARSHEGTGLGLAICDRLLALMGGRISVTSELGKGSVFTVTLPLDNRVKT